MDILDIFETEQIDNSLYNEIIRTFLKERKVVLNSQITDDVVESVILHILKFNKEDEGLPVEKRKPIMLYINSTGGDVMTGFNLCDVIKASKTPVHAVGLGYVASMGYSIFICCHKRYAFNHTVLLQHDGEVGVQNSSSKAKQTMRFLEEVDDRMKQHVLMHTNIDSDFYDEIHEQEYYMYPNKGKELGCVDAIIGVDCSLDEVL